MKRILACVSLIIILYSCTTVASNSPTKTVQAFIEASREGNIAEIKKHISSSDLSMLEIGESFLAKLDSNGSKDMLGKMAKEIKEKTKDAKIEVKDEKIDGDNATVNVQFVQDSINETRPFSLVKEDGQWKISLLSTGMKNSGANQQDLQEAMKHINIDSLKGSVGQGMEEFNKLNKDSLKNVIDNAMKDIEKLKDTSKHP
ncbi:MAG: DUF4878 domain-containing protein [Ferruginibacter sp.]